MSSEPFLSNGSSLHEDSTNFRPFASKTLELFGGDPRDVFVILYQRIRTLEEQLAISHKKEHAARKRKTEAQDAARRERRLARRWVHYFGRLRKLRYLARKKGYQEGLAAGSRLRCQECSELVAAYCPECRYHRSVKLEKRSRKRLSTYIDTSSNSDCNAVLRALIDMHGGVDELVQEWCKFLHYAQIQGDQRFIDRTQKFIFKALERQSKTVNSEDEEAVQEYIDQRIRWIVRNNPELIRRILEEES